MCAVCSGDAPSVASKPQNMLLMAVVESLFKFPPLFAMATKNVSDGRSKFEIRRDGSQGSQLMHNLDVPSPGHLRACKT